MTIVGCEPQLLHVGAMVQLEVEVSDGYCVSDRFEKFRRVLFYFEQVRHFVTPILIVQGSCRAF